MLQKILRSIGLFLLICLIISPLYTQYKQNHDELRDLSNVEIINITDQFFEDKFVCDLSSEASNKIKILHFVSPNCGACLAEAKIWHELPFEIKISHQEKSVEIIHIFRANDLSLKNMKPFVKAITGDQYKSVQTCIGMINSDDLQKINVNVFPFVIILKNKKTVYEHFGPLRDAEFINILNRIN